MQKGSTLSYPLGELPQLASATASSSPELAFVSKECWTLEDLLPLTRLSRLDYEPARVMSAPKPKVTSEGAFSAILQISLEES